MTTTPAQTLATAMGDNDSGGKSIRDYLVALLETLFNEGEGFSGKRPFGNSGWEWDLYLPLVQAGFVEGRIDDDGFLDHISDEDEVKANALIMAAIKSLGTVEGVVA